MGNDCTYKCTSISVIKKLQFEDKRNRDVLFCRFQCVDEHGHKLEKRTGVVLATKDYADLEVCADNVLSEDISDETYKQLQALMDLNDVGYTFYNPEEVAQKLRQG